MEVRDDPLPVAEITAWVTQPSRGAMGNFSGAGCDHCGGPTPVGWFSCTVTGRHALEETTVVPALSNTALGRDTQDPPLVHRHRDGASAALEPRGLGGPVRPRALQSRARRSCQALI